MPPTTVPPDNSNRCRNNKDCQYWSGVGIYDNGCRIRHSPPTAYINPGRTSIGPVTGNVNVFGLGWHRPVTGNPDIFSVRPPPVAINPGMLGIGLFTPVIIHRLTGRGFLRFLFRLSGRHLFLFRFGIAFLPLGRFIQVFRFRRYIICCQ